MILNGGLIGFLLTLFPKFSIPKGVPNYIFWGKWSCWGWREQFQWYSCLWWRCSQSCFVYSQSFFLYKAGLTEVKGNNFKDTTYDKRQKSQLKGTSSRKNAKRHKTNQQALQEMAKIIFKVKIRVFKKIIMSFLARKAHPWVVIWNKRTEL